jgi:hypothetical protein
VCESPVADAGRSARLPKNDRTFVRSKVSRFAHWCDLVTKGPADTDEDGADGKHFNGLPEDFSTTNPGSDAGGRLIR